MDHKGAMFTFKTAEGKKVYVDPNLVAYTEDCGELVRLVFSGGFDLLVIDEIGAIPTLIRAYKQGEQQ